MVRTLISDAETWHQWPRLQLMHNKLHIATIMGYRCGPCGTLPTVYGDYVIRPIYNLSGMGVGAKVVKFGQAELQDLTPFYQPGYFWCEYFHGPHFSINYVWDGNKYQFLDCYRGSNEPDQLSKFDWWERISRDYIVGEFSQLLNPPTRIEQWLVGNKDSIEYNDHPLTINIEYKMTNVIEVHLRKSSDPQYEDIIPQWGDADSKLIESLKDNGYTFIQDYDDADGNLSSNNARIGFWVK